MQNYTPDDFEYYMNDSTEEETCDHGEIQIIDENRIIIDNKVFIKKKAVIDKIPEFKKKLAENFFSKKRSPNLVIKFAKNDGCGCYEQLKDSCKLKTGKSLFISELKGFHAWVHYLNN